MGCYHKTGLRSKTRQDDYILTNDRDNVGSNEHAGFNKAVS